MQKYDQLVAQKRVLETASLQQKQRIKDHERENANQRQDIQDLNKEFKDLTAVMDKENRRIMVLEAQLKKEISQLKNDLRRQKEITKDQKLKIKDL